MTGPMIQLLLPPPAPAVVTSVQSSDTNYYEVTRTPSNLALKAFSQAAQTITSLADPVPPPISTPQAERAISRNPRTASQASLGQNQLRAIAPPVGNRAVSTLDFTPETANRRILRAYRLNQVKATAGATITYRFSSLAETGGSVSGSGGTLNRVRSATTSTAVRRSRIIAENIQFQGAKEFLEAFGANRTVLKAGAGIAQTQTKGNQSLGQNQRTQSPPPNSSLLQGLEVVADARTNTLYLLGPSRLVEIATFQLTQLDVRQRQVAVNIKILDVDLTKEKNVNADLQYQAAASLGLKFGSNSTDSQTGFSAIIGRTTNGTSTDGASSGVPSLAQNFLATLFAAVQNQSAKILTNPTLIVQERSSAQVNLTQEIFAGFEVAPSRLNVDGNQILRPRKPIIKPAGVIVNTTIDQIDDNGFVTLSLSVEVSAPSGETFQDQGSEAQLLLQRRLETGKIRLRDGQTLIVAGIIQDQERLSVPKVPLLGNITLLGGVFRRTEKTNERREVVVVVTPQILDSTQAFSPPTVTATVSSIDSQKIQL